MRLLRLCSEQRKTALVFFPELFFGQGGSVLMVFVVIMVVAVAWVAVAVPPLKEFKRKDPFHRFPSPFSACHLVLKEI